MTLKLPAACWMPACLSVFLSVFLLSVFWLFTCRGKGKKKKKEKKKKKNEQTNKQISNHRNEHAWHMATRRRFVF